MAPAINPIIGPEVVAGTLSNVSAAQVVVDMSDLIHLLEPDAAPLTVFTKSTKASKTCHNPKFQWLEDALLSKVVSVTTDGGVTLTLAAADVSKIALWDLLKNPVTNEIMLVTALASPTTLTVVRGFGTQATVTMTVPQTCVVIGNANKEFAQIRTIIMTQKASVPNFAQIFRTPLGISRTLKDTQLYGEDEKTYQIRKRGIEHRTDMERSFLFGQPVEQDDASDSNGGGAGNAGGRWMTGGIDYFITSNRYDAGGTLTYNVLLDFAQQVFRYGNKRERLCFAAPVVLSAVARMAAEKLLVQNSAKVFGVKVFEIETPHGDFMLVKHPLLQETSFYNERMFALDMEVIRERPFVNADTKFLTNRQQPSADGEMHEYLTQIGLEVANEQKHGVLYNVQL